MLVSKEPAGTDAEPKLTTDEAEAQIFCGLLLVLPPEYLCRFRHQNVVIYRSELTAAQDLQRNFRRFVARTRSPRGTARTLRTEQMAVGVQV